MQLIETVEWMVDDSYAKRFVAEYCQVKIRYNKLKHIYDNWSDLDFVPTCDKSIYRTQLDAMEKYIEVLETRAKIEEINLPDNI